MRTIEFTESEIGDIASYYQSELIKAKQRVEAIESILTQLGVSKTSSTPASITVVHHNDHQAGLAPSTPQTTGLPRPKRYPNRSSILSKKETKSIIAELHNTLAGVAKDQAEAPPTEAPSNADISQLKLNGKWIRFIVDLLERHSRVIAADDFVSEAIYTFDVPDEKQPVTRQVIYNTLYKLDLSKRLIGSCTVPGRKGKRYGLRKWFTAEGEIQASFLAKAT